LGQGKKLVQAPKELPEIPSQAGAPPPMISQKEHSEIPAPVPPHPQPAGPPPAPKKDLNLPKVEAPPRREPSPAPVQEDDSFHEEDMKEFEEAINNINIDVIHTETPKPSAPAQSPEEERKAESDYYKPGELGEGYFSEIEHYVKNKNVHEIVDDIIKKDFLTSMKDYHDTKAEGKPYYLHKHDLEHKLRKKMDYLRKLEEEWHTQKAQIRERENKQREVETVIDKESQELKELFRQVKINHWLEQKAPKEHYFKLNNGKEIKSLNDLRKALSHMADEEFTHHVSEEKNDFAAWVKEALQNQEIYEKIKDIKVKEELEEVLQNPI